MSWQDIVFSVGSWIFVISLIPTIRGKQKPAFSTSLISAIVLAFFVVTYISLGLWMSALAVFGTVVCWSILAYQRYRQKK